MNGPHLRLHRLFESAIANPSAANEIGIEVEQFARSHHPLACQILAEIALSGSYPRDLRLIAYICLFEITGRSLCNIPRVDLMRIPEDFDMGIINEYLNGSPTNSTFSIS